MTNDTLSIFELRIFVNFSSVPKHSTKYEYTKGHELLNTFLYLV
jgi:hypothetical protein